MTSSTGRGLARVGVDEVAAFAGVTKRTLYYHFRSKDELLAAVFDLQHELALARIRNMWLFIAEMPEDILDVLFSELARWTARPGFAGAVSHALSWNSPICQVIQHVLSHVVTKRQSNPGTRNYLQARKLSLHRTLRGRSHF